MPFTFAHPAIVLPLAKRFRKYFSITALVAGSMAPDFFFFAQLKFSGSHGHALPGITLSDILMGLAMCFVFHLVVRRQLIQNLPGYFQVRLQNSVEYDFFKYFKKHWLVVVSSLLVGIFSHYLWDSFTHDHGYFVERFSLLRTSLELFGHTLAISDFLQMGCTLLGLSLILYFVCRLPAQTSKVQPINAVYWILFVIFFLLFNILVYGTGFRELTSGNLILTAIAGGLAAVIISPLVLALSRRGWRGLRHL